MGDDGPGADDGTLADSDSGQQHGAGPDVRPIVYPHGLDHQVGLDDRHVDRQAGVGRSQHFGPRPPTHVVTEHQVPSVKVALGADPNVVADLAAAIEATLDEGLAADENAVADLEGLGVLEADTGLDSQPRPAGAGQRQPQDAPHGPIEHTLALDEAAVELDQTLAAALRGEVLGKLARVGGVRGTPLAPVHRLDHALVRAVLWALNRHARPPAGSPHTPPRPGSAPAPGTWAGKAAPWQPSR